MAKRKQVTKNQAPAAPPTAGEKGFFSFLASVIKNGLGEAIGFRGRGNEVQQVSSAESLFVNLRWSLISYNRMALSQCYVEIGVIQTVVDIPVDDAFQDGVEFTSKELDEDQIKQLQLALEAEGDIDAVIQAAKWNRLFGGAAVLIWISDQDPEDELDMKAIGPDSKVKFFAVDMWELYSDSQQIDEDGPPLEDPTSDFYTYNYVQIHKSRVRKLRGMTAPSFVRKKLRTWGFSVVEVLIRSVNQYLKGTDLTFEVLDEFKVDVYKIKNLVNTLLSPDGEAQVAKRIQMANWQKNYQNAVVMDAEDDWDHKQLSFAGLAEAGEGIRIQLAADMRMPITKLFGTSMSKGFGTDQNDMENYNSMVKSQVRKKVKSDVLLVAKIRCQALFGMIPEDLEAIWKPLRELTAVDEETVKTQKHTRLQAAADAGRITTLEYREACNKGSLFDVKLDTSTDSLNPDDPEIETVLAGKAAEGDGDPDADPKDPKSEGEKA